MSDRDNVTHVVFGRDVAYNATGIADVDYGELIAIKAEGGAILSAAALGAQDDDVPFHFVVGKGNSNLKHWISPRLTKRSITAHRGKSYAAATQQVSYIGDNGSSGDINAANSTEYILNVKFYYDKDISGRRPIVRQYSYTSDASATAAEIQNNFVTLMNADAEFARQATAAAETGGGNNGISITGKALTDINLAIDEDVIVKFKITLEAGFDSTVGVDEFGYLYVNGAAPTTTGSTSVSPDPGVGTYNIMRAMERDAKQVTTGRSNLRKFPIVQTNDLVSSTGTYDVYVIDFYNEHQISAISPDTRRSRQSIVIANDISTTTNSTTLHMEALLYAATGITVNL
jgi:hypothetical protein